MKKKHKRSILLTIVLFCCSIAVIIICTTLKENISFFYSPTELLSANVQMNKMIRIGGVVVKGTIIRSSSHIDFSITDIKNTIPVVYKRKVLPTLFKENSGVVAEGYFIDGKFIAHSLLAKHNESYRPNKV